MTSFSTLPESVRDSRLEAHFKPTPTYPRFIIHPTVSGRRSWAKPVVWARQKLLEQGGNGLIWLEKRVESLENPSGTPELRAVKQIRVFRPISESDKFIRELDALAKFSKDKVSL
jgi:hypothetical protein